MPARFRILVTVALAAVVLVTATPALAGQPPTTPEQTTAVTVVGVPDLTGAALDAAWDLLDVQASGDAHIQLVGPSCRPGWVGVVGCMVRLWEFGTNVYHLLGTNRYCVSWRVEYLVNPSNGSVTGTRYVCTQWRTK